MPDVNALITVAKLIQDAERILFITGAGLSADSGLPTYRGAGGLYDDRATDDGMAIEEALSGATLARRPEVTWKYLWQIAEAGRRATFNHGHAVIAGIERRKPGTWVLTQNIDGFHRDAGSRQLIEIHGSSASFRCPQCGDAFTRAEFIVRYTEQPSLPPLCLSCGGVVRPDVVLFGETLPEEAVAQLIEVVAREPDLVIVVGTSALFPYILEPVLRARALGVPTVEINPAQSELSDIVEHRIASGGAETLAALWELMD